MTKKIVELMALSLLLATVLTMTLPVSAAMQNYASPRMDEVWLVRIDDPTVATTAFQTGTVDTLSGMIRWANILKLQNENNTIISAPAFHYCYLGINCRSYVPSDAGQPDAGRALAPLNYTGFRQALGWAGMSVAQKSAWISTIHGGPINTPQSTVVPPSLGVWYDPSVVAPGGNNATALAALTAAGFTISGGKLIQPNGVEARDTINVFGPSTAPTSAMWTNAWVNQWNAFFDQFLGVTNCNFVAVLKPSYITEAFTYRDHDIYFLCWSLGRFPDFLYDFFHSSQDYPDSNNSPGVYDATLDAELYYLKYGLDYATKIADCHAAQHLLVEQLCPYVPVYSRTYYCAYKDFSHYTSTAKKLVNMINQYGYGPDNSWTWNLMHWNTSDTGGSYKYCVGGIVERLHPGWSTWAYEWDILTPLYDSLISVRPDLGDAPSVACNWTVESFNWAPLNIIDGTKVTFQIRSDAKWQDGVPVTVQDIQFVLGAGSAGSGGFLRNFPRYGSIYEYLGWTQIKDPCTIEVYMNVTSQWILYDLAGAALLFPQHIYDPVTGWLAKHGYDPVNDMPGAIITDYPSPSPYMTHNLTALMGSGPYIFDYYDYTTTTGHLVKNPNYWINHSIKANIIQPQRTDPETPITFTNATGPAITVIRPCDWFNWTGDTPEVGKWIDVTINGTVYNLHVDAVTATQFHVDKIISTDVNGRSITTNVTGINKTSLTGGTPAVIYSVELVNMGTKDSSGNLAPITIDWIDVTNSTSGTIIQTIIGPFVINPFDYLVLGPYCYSFPRGLQQLDCHIYADGGKSFDNYTCPMWVTIKQDANLDFKVDGKDLGAVAGAFGSYPGHPIWASTSDVNNDYKIDGKDLGDVAGHFGWPPFGT
jgi:ABC-type transport system substrate-binding protein